MLAKKNQKVPEQGIGKCSTGIAGLDEITGGGLTRGRSALFCGGTGCGKTLLAVEFIVRGISPFWDPAARLDGSHPKAT